MFSAKGCTQFLLRKRTKTSEASSATFCWNSSVLIFIKKPFFLLQSKRRLSDFQSEERFFDCCKNAKNRLIFFRRLIGFLSEETFGLGHQSFNGIRRKEIITILTWVQKFLPLPSSPFHSWKLRPLLTKSFNDRRLHRRYVLLLLYFTSRFLAWVPFQMKEPWN